MIVSFVNLKGGCGKSTSSVHLSRWLLNYHGSVALVDTDYLAASSMWVEHLEQQIAQPTVFQMHDPSALVSELPKISQGFTTIVVDGASQSGEIQAAILQISDLVLIPLQPSILDISTTHQTINAVRLAQNNREQPLRAFTFLMRVTSKSVLVEEAREFLRSYEDVPLLETELPQRQVVADAMAQNKTLFDYQGDRNAKTVSRCYEKLFQEVNLR
ncbi:MAG: AAA family ATPase [Microcoleaceae cyanobacterium]